MREQWLSEAVEKFREHFKANGVSLPKRIEVSVGFTSFGVKSSVIGETWPRNVSKRNTNQIFISPNLLNPVDVLTVLAHELVHVHLDCEFGHTGPFQKLAKRIGLTAPWVEATASRDLLNLTQKWAKDLGTYPHSGFKQHLIFTDTQKSYLQRVSCKDCGYKMRITSTWLNKAIPDCPLCKEVMIVG